MSFKPTLLIAGLAALSLPGIASAQMIIEDAYARASGPSAQSGAVFMVILNQSDTDDRVTGVTSDAAARVELHTHIEDENGVMRMRHVVDGFPIAAGESHTLARGGDHIMFMGLSQPWHHAVTITVTLIFEHADPVETAMPSRSSAISSASASTPPKLMLVVLGTRCSRSPFTSVPEMRSSTPASRRSRNRPTADAAASSFCRASVAATPSPMMPGRFSVPARRRSS